MNARGSLSRLAHFGVALFIVAALLLAALLFRWERALLDWGERLAMNLTMVCLYLRGLARRGERALPLASLPVVLCVYGAGLSLDFSASVCRRAGVGVLLGMLHVLYAVGMTVEER